MTTEVKVKYAIMAALGGGMMLSMLAAVGCASIAGVMA